MTLIKIYIYLIFVYVFIAKVGLINTEILFFLLPKEVDLALFCDLHLKTFLYKSNKA